MSQHPHRAAPDPNTVIRVRHADPFAIPPAPVPVHLAGATAQPRASRWPHVAALSVIVALLGAYAWTLPASRTHADATMVAGRAWR